MPLSNMAVRDIETVIHPYTNLARHREVGPLILNEGRGIYLYDDKGKRYIEGLAGLWCTALGYGNEEIAEAGAAALRKVSFTHSFGGKSHDGVIELSEKLKELSPVPASKILFGTSGSEGNDMQMKLTWYMNNARGTQSSGGIGSGGLSVDTGVSDGAVPRSILRQTGLVTRHTLAEARAQQAERILLADDNKPNQMLVVRLLERRGYRVDVVAGECAQLAGRAPPQAYDA